MKASLDTNVIVHLYRAQQQEMLFAMFEDGIFIDDFIYKVELEHRGKDILPEVESDITSGKLKIIGNTELKELGILPLYFEYLEEEKQIYSHADEGEAHTIALARCLGSSAISVVTDDTKDKGPHYFLLRIKDLDIIPLAFYEILILLYLKGMYSAKQTIEVFNKVMEASFEYSYEFRSKIKAFSRRFVADPYTDRDADWFDAFCHKEHVAFKTKIKNLVNELDKQHKNSMS